MKRYSLILSLASLSLASCSTCCPCKPEPVADVPKETLTAWDEGYVHHTTDEDFRKQAEVNLRISRRVNDSFVFNDVSVHSDYDQDLRDEMERVKKLFKEYQSQ